MASSSLYQITSRNKKIDEYSFTDVELIARGPDQIVCLQATYTIRAVHTVLSYK